VSKNQNLSALLNQREIPYLLNARPENVERESECAQAGRKGALTIATNMAGRGTDTFWKCRIHGAVEAAGILYARIVEDER